MVLRYTPKVFMRQAPNRLLRRYFEAKGLLTEIPWDGLKETKIEPVHEANLDAWALSSATPGMFAEIFGFAAWTRALYSEEIRELALGPWVLLGKRHRFWYAPLMAYRSAQIAGGSSFTAVGFRGTPRSAAIAGTSSLMAPAAASGSRAHVCDPTREPLVFAGGRVAHAHCPK